MAHAWREMVAQYGAPLAGSRATPRRCGVAAVGYGKLGGHELGYGSDLDLVFLHDSGGELQETEGPTVIDNAVFFLRLGQKIVHFLTVHSAAGRLYEVDMRLRPSGKGGLLVSNIEAFRDYQREEAWTWEHQALLHSRAVAGTPAIRERFEQVRAELLCHHVHRDRLREDVRHMRDRMRTRAVARGGGGIRHQAGPGRRRRHRVPGPVLGAALGRRVSAARDVFRHDPSARVGGLRRARRPLRHRRAGRRLPRLPQRDAPAVAGGRPAGGRGGAARRRAQDGHGRLERGDGAW